MLTADLLAFARASLPGPPARILEIGAGSGDLAQALRDAGHEVRAIDPAADSGGPVEPLALIDVDGQFDAALAVVSLHHLEPLDGSVARLASVLSSGGLLVIDEIDFAVYDEVAASWWLNQRRILGLPTESLAPAEMVARLHGHMHSAADIRAALEPFFELGAPVRGPYLHRWELDPALYPAEVEAIAGGILPAVGWRQVAVRR